MVLFFPVRSMRDRMDLREGSLSMKVVTKTVPFSTMVRKEKRRRERKMNMGRREKEVTAASRRIEVVVRWSSLGGGSSAPSLLPPLFIVVILGIIIGILQKDGIIWVSLVSLPDRQETFEGERKKIVV